MYNIIDSSNCDYKIDTKIENQLSWNVMDSSTDSLSLAMSWTWFLGYVKTAGKTGCLMTEIMCKPSLEL